MTQPGTLCLLAMLLAACERVSPSFPATSTAHPATVSAVASPPAPGPALNPPAVSPAPHATTHIVEQGDTLLGLAKQYGVPMAALQLENGMGESTVLHVGQVLAIPEPAAWEAASPFWIVHRVQAGETLVGLAHTYDLEVEAIQTVNGLSDAKYIQAGQDLILPLDAPAAIPPTPTATPQPTPTPTATPLPPSPTVEPTRRAPVPTEPAPTLTAVPPAPPPSDVAAWPRETVRIINQVRAQHGLPPLAYNETLAAAAQAHANDCSLRGSCSHTGSDGADIKTRIVRAGYSPSGWAECWAQSQSPQHAVDMWMDEEPPNDPHRRTLLTTWLTEIGMGVAQTTWGYYFIADFGRP